MAEPGSNDEDRVDGGAPSSSRRSPDRSGNQSGIGGVIALLGWLVFALGMVSAVSTMIVLRDAAEPSGSAVGFNEQMAAAAPAFAVIGVGLTAAAAGILVTAVQRRPDLSASRAD